MTARTLGVCWVVFGISWLLESAQHFAPLSFLIEALLGMQGDIGDFVAIFLYWTLFGLGLAWTTRNPRDVDALLTRGVVAHVVITVVSWVPMMLIFSSR